MKDFIKALTHIFVIGCMLIGCSEDDPDILTFQTTNYEIVAQGGTLNVPLVTNQEINVQIPTNAQSWIRSLVSTDPASKQAKSITFTINTSEEYDNRTADVVVFGGSLSEIIHITQKGEPILKLNKKEIIVSQEGETISLQTSANMEYEVVMPNVDWIQRANTRAVVSRTESFDIKENDTYEKRQADIIFKDPKSNANETFSIIQDPIAKIEVSKDRFLILGPESSFSVAIVSNVDYDITIEDRVYVYEKLVYSNWISKGSIEHKDGEDVVSFKVDMMDSGWISLGLGSVKLSSREGKIIIKNKKTGIYKEIYIKQIPDENAKIELSGKSFESKKNGGDFSVNVVSNVDYEVILSDNWIKQTNMESKNGKDIYYFSIDALEKSGKDRTGTIEFKNDEFSVSEIVTVIQHQEIVAQSISLSKYSSSYNYGTKNTLQLTSYPQDADVDCDWISSNSNIMRVVGNDKNATIQMVGFGKATLEIKDRISGLSKKYDFQTKVTGFSWKKTNETAFDYGDMVTLVIGETLQLEYSSDQGSYIPYLCNPKNFTYKEKSRNVMVVVDSPSNISIDENGVVKGLKNGLTEIRANGTSMISKSASGNDRIYINVVDHYTEQENNNTPYYANKYKGPTEFSLSSKTDTDCFEITLPNSSYTISHFDINLESLIGEDLSGYKVSIINSDGTFAKTSRIIGTKATVSGSGYSGNKLYVYIEWDFNSSYAKYWINNHSILLTIKNK